MAAAAVRAGLVAALAGILVAGGVADATETPPMTKPEAKAFKKEIADKLTAFRETYHRIENDLNAEFHDEYGDEPFHVEAFKSYPEEVAAAVRKQQKATYQFLNELRACLDAANAEDPHQADANAGSVVHAAVASASATVAKEASKTDRTLQQIQAEARKACTPVTILNNPAPLVFNYAGPPADGPILNDHIRTGNIVGLAVDSEGSLGAVASFRCLAPHAYSPACDPDTAELVVTSPLGTQSAVVDVSEGVSVWGLELADDPGPFRAQCRHTKDGETSGFDAYPRTFRVTVTEVSDGDCPPNAGTLNGSPFAIDGLFDANRILYPDRTTLNLNYVTYPYVAGGEVLIQVNLQHSDGTSGVGSFPVLSGPTPTGESWVRVYVEGSAVQGTLTCNNLAAILFDSGPGPLGLRFFGAGGTTTLDLCEKKEDVPLLDGSSLKAVPPTPPQRPESPPE